MAEFVSGYAPNRLTTVNTDNSTSPLIIAMDGTGYASLASLRAAGKTPFPFGNTATPGLDIGMFAQWFTVENVTEAKAFSVAWNTAVAPTVDSATLMPDGIVQFQDKGPVWCVWIIKSVGSDHLVLTVGY